MTRPQTPGTDPARAPGRGGDSASLPGARTTDALFDVDGPQPKPVENLSPDARRRARQYNALLGGSHPLSLATGRHISLHLEAAPADDRDADGRRCGTCIWRRQTGHRSRSYPKCHVDPRHLTHGAGTDVAAWWPACADHEPEA